MSDVFDGLFSQEELEGMASGGVRESNETLLDEMPAGGSMTFVPTEEELLQQSQEEPVTEVSIKEDASMRIYEFAKEVGLESKEVLALSEQLGLSHTSHMNSLTADEKDLLLAELSKETVTEELPVEEVITEEVPVKEVPVEKEATEEAPAEESPERDFIVVPVSGRPDNNSPFPVHEGLVWKEITRVIDGIVKNMADKGGYRLGIPIFNKFDIEFLRAAERHDVPVTFILPFESWGDSRLPQNQIDLISIMKRREGNTISIYNGKSFTERVESAVAHADMVIGFYDTVGLEHFYPAISFAQKRGAKVAKFPVNRMRYQTEDDARAYLAEQTETSSLSHVNAEQVLFGD